MAASMDQDQVSFGPFHFDLSDSKLSFQGAPIALSSRALNILRVLALAKGNVVSKDRLLDAVWPGLAVEENNIQVHISALRKELDRRTDGESFIITMPGRGYRLVGLERPPEIDQSEMGGPAGFVIPGASIAVLPFQNMSGDPEQEYFADGIVEDIITGLSRIKWLFVIARNSSFVHKGKAVDLKQIGHDLGVRYLVEGSVRKAGDRVRITVQLIDAKTGGHLWIERYDRLLDDIFAVQDEITMRVIGAIEPNLRKVEIARVKRKRPDNLDAYDLVLRAICTYGNGTRRKCGYPAAETGVGARTRICLGACSSRSMLPLSLQPRRTGRSRSPYFNSACARRNGGWLGRRHNPRNRRDGYLVRRSRCHHRL
jgi:TolB-like protein